MDGTEYGGGRFADSEEALAAMARYERFLQLQEEADGLTDEEYLRRLDEISGGDPSELLQGAESYGDMDTDEMARAAAIRAAEDMPVTEQGGTAGTAHPGSGPETDGVHAEQGPQLAGTAGAETDLDDDREDGLYDGPGDGTPWDSAQERQASADGSGYGPPEGDSGLDAQEAAEQEDAYEDGAAGGQQAETDAGNVVTDAHHTDVWADHEAELEDEPEDTLEVPAQKAAPEQEGAGYAAAALVPEDEDGPEQRDGYFKEHSRFDVHDIFDDMAVGTGLAGAVVSYEYVPPAPVSGQQPEKSPSQPQTPALAAVYREIERMDGPGRQEPEVSGPAGP